jgi:hypothetical protein
MAAFERGMAQVNEGVHQGLAIAKFGPDGAEMRHRIGWDAAGEVVKQNGP